MKKEYKDLEGRFFRGEKESGLSNYYKIVRIKDTDEFKGWEEFSTIKDGFFFSGWGFLQFKDEESFLDKGDCIYFESRGNLWEITEEEFMEKTAGQ